MTLLDGLRKSREVQPPTTPPPAGHVLAEILQDKNKFHLFGKLLGKDGREDLAERLATGKLEDSDIDVLEQARQQFSEKITKSEGIENLLTKDNVIDFAKNNPEFEKILNLVGPERAIKAIKSQIRDLSITDEGRFLAIAYAIEEYESFKNGDYKKTNDEVEKFCTDKKITPEEYLAALEIQNPIEKEKALKELSGRTYGKFRKALNFITRGRLGQDKTLKELKSSEVLLESSITDLDAYSSDIGSVLSLSIKDNDALRAATFAELSGERIPEDPKLSLKEAKAGNFSEDGWKKDWEACKTKNNFATATPADQDLLRDTFMTEQKDAYKKKTGKGFWQGIVEAITEALIDSKKGELN